MTDLPDYLRDVSLELKLERAKQKSITLTAKPREEWPDPVEWIQKRFYIYDTGDLFEFHERQARPLREALRIENGKYVYQTVLWSWMKKSAKSTIIAAVADYIAWHKPRAQIRLVANDLNQADSRVGFYMRENIKIAQQKGYDDDPFGTDAELRRKTKISISGYSIKYPNGSVIEMVPVDPAGEAGGNDDMVVFSELWGWKSKAHQQMWSEMTISPTKFGLAQRWIDTYAGFVNDSPVLERLYEQIVKEENKIWEPDWEVYALGKTFATWTTIPCLPWQTAAYYAQEEQDLAVEEFLRMHRNQFVDSVTSFVPYAWWKSCLYDVEFGKQMHWPNAYPPLQDWEEVVLAIDAGTDSDCFTIVGVSYDRYYRKKGEPPGVILRYARAWYPETFENFTFDEPEAEAIRLCEKFNVIQLCYDPWQMKKFADDFRKKGLTWVEVFDQGAERAVADKILYDLVRQTRLRHFGDPTLDEHVKNSKKKTDGRGLRIIKGEDDRKKIDLTVALSMAVKRCLDLVPEE